MQSENHPLNENQKRALVALRLIDFSFGTMWWVKEWLWKIVIPRRLHYDLGSTRPEHPGISIQLGQAPTQSHTPLMHGASDGTNSSVWITGFSANDPCLPTAFGHLIRPGVVPTVWVGHFPVNESNFRHEWVRLFGHLNNPPQVQFAPIRKPSGPKKKATQDERQRLNDLLRSLKVII